MSSVSEGYRESSASSLSSSSSKLAPKSAPHLETSTLLDWEDENDVGALVEGLVDFVLVLRRRRPNALRLCQRHVLKVVRLHQEETSVAENVLKYRGEIENVRMCGIWWRIRIKKRKRDRRETCRGGEYVKTWESIRYKEVESLHENHDYVI